MSSGGTPVRERPTPSPIASPLGSPSSSMAGGRKGGGGGQRGYFAISVLAMAVVYATVTSLSFFQGYSSWTPQRQLLDRSAAVGGGSATLVVINGGGSRAGGDDGDSADGADAGVGAAGVGPAPPSSSIDAALAGLSSVMSSFYAAGQFMIGGPAAGGASAADAAAAAAAAAAPGAPGDGDGSDDGDPEVVAVAGSAGTGAGSASSAREWVERNPDPATEMSTEDGPVGGGGDGGSPFGGGDKPAADGEEDGGDGEQGEDEDDAAQAGPRTAPEDGEDEEGGGGGGEDADVVDGSRASSSNSKGTAAEEGGGGGNSGATAGGSRVAGGSGGRATKPASGKGSLGDGGSGGGKEDKDDTAGSVSKLRAGGGGGGNRGTGRRGDATQAGVDGGGGRKQGGGKAQSTVAANSGSGGKDSNKDSGSKDGASGKDGADAGAGRRRGRRGRQGGGDGDGDGGDGNGGGKPDGPVVTNIPADTPAQAAERLRLGNRSHPLGALDLQIPRDLMPWRRRGGFSLEDVLATRSHRAPLIDRVGNFSSGMITAVVKNNVVYMLASEIPGIIEQYGVGSKGKIRDFQAMLTAVARVYRLPDAYFLWNVHPWPLLRARSAPPPSIETTPFASDSESAVATAPPGLAPVMSLCKTDGELDVLYPNMYFQTPNYWWKVTSSIAKAAEARPWEGRKPKVWWRGASGWTWPAAAPRVLTLARWHGKPWADLAFTSPWRSQLNEWGRMGPAAPWLKSLPRSVRKIPGGPEMRTTMEAVARYRYSLQLPGSYGATYSRTLQFLVWTGTTIFFYDCPYYEYYYHHLAPGVHYVPVNVTNLGDKVKWAQANPAKAERIAAASARFARERLTAAHFALYWKQLLDEYAALQRFRVKLPDDACTCWPARRARDAEASRPRYVPKGTKRCRFICDFGA